ncbi:hypothetical protein [Flavobacterium eburneipallidum]|uniref:hypothetical protein n=1 Tax=Flavobacterium eburneipallidum TaxID=3003263 RepID=UPI002482EF29|nr:hypothetical protein [Flavobacterium eburneipallidum]
MKTKIIIILICALLISCNRQKKENVIKPIKNLIIMKKLDDIYLNKIQEINQKNQKIQFDENDSIVELVDNGNTYIETRRKKNHAIYNYFTYDKNNYLMITSGTQFYTISIDISRRYNEKGQIEEEKNWEENFPFSVYDLITKIKTTNQLDLNSEKKDLLINRGLDKETDSYIYLIRYNISKYDGSYKYIKVDGATGEILSEGSDYFL